MIKLILTLVLYLETGIVTCVSVIQSDKLLTFLPGETIILTCVISEFHENYFSWFRQSLGEAPTCIVTLYDGSEPILYGDFKHTKRFTAEKNENQFTLTIIDTKQNDTGMYYCAVRDYDLVVFGNGVFLKYKGPDLNHHYYIKEIASLDHTEKNLKLKELVDPGDSVTLQCTIITESCAGEHSVYWFRHGSGESHPGIIYTHGNSSGQCKKSAEAGSPTQSCVYNLPKRNFSTSDAGTYYCAVVLCGKILFGNGSKHEFTEQKYEFIQMYWNILGLAVSNVVCLIIIALLLCLWAKKRNMSTPETTDYIATFEPEKSHVTSTSFINESAETEGLSYAPLKFPARKSKRQETQEDTCRSVIYSSVSGLD